MTTFGVKSPIMRVLVTIFRSSQLKRISIGILAAFLALAGGATAEQLPRQIVVSGEGRVETNPDMAMISVGVTHQADEARAAMAATSDALAQVLDRLTAVGLEPRDIQTRSLTLSPVWSHASSSMGRSKITGYVAGNTLQIRVRDLSELGRILGQVIGDGANDFGGLAFGVQDPAPLLDQARQAAVADAVAKANLLAAAAGVSLGQVQSITDHGNSSPAPMRMEMSAARDSGVPVAPGEISLSASVSMVFAIGD